MESLNETFDNRTRDQLQILNLHQNLRIDEPIRRCWYDRRTHTLRLSLSIPISEPERCHQPLDDVLGPDSFRLRMEVRQNAVSEYRVSEGLDVLDRNVITPVHQSPRLRTKNQELRSAQAGTVVHVLLHKIRRIRSDRDGWSGRAGQRNA